MRATLCALRSTHPTRFGVVWLVEASYLNAALPRDIPFPAAPDMATRRIVLAGAMLSMLLAALDSSIVNTALPRMAADLGGLTHLSWVVTGFMLCSTITAPLYGKFSDNYGRGLTFGVSLGVFLLGSILCGLAQSMDELIGFRALQGLGAGGLFVLAQAMIGDVVAPIDRPRYQGLFTGVFGLASIAGPLLGGVITQALSWRWIFYVNMPIGAAALVMILLGVKSLGGGRRAGKSRPVDLLGAALLACTTAGLLLLLASGGNQFPWLSWRSAGIGGGILLLFSAFLWAEARAGDPLIRLGLFRNAVIARGSAVSAMVIFAMLGALVFMPLYFQLVLGMSPAGSGAMILPQVGGMLLTSTIGGRFVSRLGRYRPFLLAGLGMEGISLILLAVFAWTAASPAMFLVLMGVFGLGMGLGMPNLVTAIQNAVAHAELGAATGALVFIRSLGGAVGVAASGAIMSFSLTHAHAGGAMRILRAQGAHGLAGLAPAQHAAIAQAYRAALTGSFSVCAVVMAMAFVLVLGLPDVRLRAQIED